MAIYIFLLIVVICGCLIESCSSTLILTKLKLSSRKLSFWICFFSILLVGLFRNELLGVDVANYKEYFNSWYTRYDFVYVLKSFEMDNGYILLNKIVESLTHNFYFFKCLAYIIVFGLFSAEIYRKSKYPACSYLIYLGLGFLGINFCLLRQAFAYSICFFSFKYYEKNKMVKFILLVFVAITFHKTAVFFLLVYPLSKDIFKRYAIIKKAILVILFMLFSVFIIPNLFQFYMNDYYAIAERGQGFNLLIFYFVILIVMSQLKKTARNNTSEKTLEYEASFCTVYFQIGALFFSLFTRVTNFYALLLTISIPNLLEGSEKRKLYLAFFMCAFSVMYILNLYVDSCDITPYISIFKTIQ